MCIFHNDTIALSFAVFYISLSQHRMSKMVRKHLSKKHVILEEDLLEKIADSTDKSETISLTTVSHHCIL